MFTVRLILAEDDALEEAFQKEFRLFRKQFYSLMTFPIPGIYRTGFLIGQKGSKSKPHVF